MSVINGFFGWKFFSNSAFELGRLYSAIGCVSCYGLMCCGFRRYGLVGYELVVLWIEHVTRNSLTRNELVFQSSTNLP